MCANCGFPEAPGHWTEAGTFRTFDRMQARHMRAKVLRSVLRAYGLTAYDDGATPGITISTLTGNQEIAADLAEVWEIAEKLCGRLIDPLALEFVGEPVEAGSAGEQAVAE
jgi:hypothetical protein